MISWLINSGARTQNLSSDFKTEVHYTVSQIQEVNNTSKTTKIKYLKGLVQNIWLIEEPTNSHSIHLNLGLWGYGDNKADLEFLDLIPALRFIQSLSHTESAEQG